MPTRRQNYEQDIVFFLSRWSSIVHMASWVNKHPVESHWWIEDFPGCHVWLSTCRVSLKWHGYRWTLETLRRRCAATSFVTSWPLGDTSKCGIRLVAHPRKRGPVGQSWPRFTIAGQAEIRPVYQVHTGIYRGVTIFFMFKKCGFVSSPRCYFKLRVACTWYSFKHQTWKTRGTNTWTSGKEWSKIDIFETTGFQCWVLSTKD